MAKLQKKLKIKNKNILQECTIYTTEEETNNLYFPITIDGIQAYVSMGG